ncbi:MAG: glycosyl hydrolase family 5 [Nannocystales bacterium]
MRARSVTLLTATLVASACGDGPEQSPAKPTVAAPSADSACDEPAPALAWTLEPRSDGSLALSVDRSTFLVLRHGALRAAGSNAKPSVRKLPSEADTLAFEVTFESLPVVIRGLASLPTPSQVRLEYTFEARQALRDVLGVGLQVDLDAQTWSLPTDALEIIEGRDLRVSSPALGQVEVAFDRDGAVPRTARDHTRPTRVRSAWLAGDSPAGTTTAAVTLTVPGTLALQPPLAARYGPRNLAQWHRDALVHDDWPVDLSHLNAAHGRAGSHGPVRVDGESLRFEDGTEARFWGTNLAASALFKADDATIIREAKRLCALGYNLVRLHHHDAAWTDRNVFDTSEGNTQKLDAKALDRLDFWIDTLASEGIYVWLDLHTGRSFLPGDAIPGYADMLSGPHPKQARGFQYINPRVGALLEGFAESYLRRKNPYTGRPWAQEPAVVGLLLTNENDLTHHFGVAFRPETGRETHIALFDALAKDITAELGLPRDAVRSVHRPGPGKVLLAEMQHRWDARALAHLRGLGATAPAVTTNFWGYESLLSLPPLASGDMLDAHSYGKTEALSKNPHRTAHWLHHIAAAQVSGKPLTVTEWAVPKPAADRHSAGLWIAALGGLQGWDALLAYNYAQTPLASAPTRQTQWDQRVDPAQLGLAPTAALMFRRGDIALARTTTALVPSLDAVYGAHTSPKRQASLRTAAEQTRMVIVLPDHPQLDWDTAGTVPSGATVVTDLDEDLLDPSATSIRSDTGELERDWTQGVLRIDSPRVQAASGWLGGKTITLGDLRVRVETPTATVSAISLDDAPLAGSRRILVTAVGRAEPQPDGHVRSEPISGEIALRTQSNVKIAALGARSRAWDIPEDAEAIPGTREGAWVRLPLPDAPTHWFILVLGP